MDEYVVLTFESKGKDTLGGLEHTRGPMAKPTSEAPATMSMEVKPLDAKEEEANRDANKIVARAGFPLALVEPVAVDEVAIAATAAAPPWGLVATKATLSSRKGKGAKVAVLDTGCDINHPAFAALKAANKIVGKNFCDGDERDISDSHGHGTHCAGTICGGTVDGIRIGVAPEIEKLIVGKVLGPGGGSNAKILQAIQWAVDEGATIISMSLGMDFPGWVKALITGKHLDERVATSMALKDYRDAVAAFGKLADFLRTREAVIVCASGNESSRPNFTLDKAPPSASDHIISVAALGASGTGFTVANFSNANADVSGPGVNIMSAKANSTTLVPMSGTSMATPHVAGIAALWFEELFANNGSVSQEDLRAKLRATAVRPANLTRADAGAGLVQAPA